MTARELEELAGGLGIDAIGATPARPYEQTEEHIRERRERGLFADLRFTMAQPEVSCHPETLLPGARTVVSAALCYYAPAPEPKPGEGRMPRYTWWDAYAEHMGLYLLGIGAPSRALPTETWDAWHRPVVRYAGRTFIQGGPLFTHQYAQAWFEKSLTRG